jgi:hypothetical protein
MYFGDTLIYLKLELIFINFLKNWLLIVRNMVHDIKDLKNICNFYLKHLPM